MPSAHLVVQIFGDGIAATHELPPGGSLSIGRTAENDVQIDDPSISRRHVRVHDGEDGVEIEDQGSSNGTVVRGVRRDAVATGQVVDTRLAAGERARLAPGDVVSLGSVILVVQAASGVKPRRAVAPARKPAAPGPPPERGVVVSDPAMRRVHELVGRVAAGDISVLLLGETGVGKDVVAEAVHRASPRAEHPLLRLNCAALSQVLLDSELFGYERGAFTGADKAKPGLLETANGGSVFLDEIGEMPPPTQAKLLRVLEDRQVLPLGALKPRAIDVRFISATNRDLEAEIARGGFRRDLYFRLNGVSLLIPPLRERKGEVPLLLELFLREGAAKLGRRVPDVDPAAAAVIAKHDWPGNVRELKNVVERALLLCGDGPLTVDHLPVDKMTPAGQGPSHLRGQMDAMEKERILAALEECAGNQTQAAKLLGMPRRTLVKRLDGYGVKRPRKR